MCHACLSRPNSKCIYDVTLDQRKPSSLRQRVGELEDEAAHFRNIVELLLSALPERLKPRFEGFVQAVEEGGFSSDLVDDVRARLDSVRSPEDEVMQEAAQQMDSPDVKFSMDPASQLAMGDPQASGQRNDPYFFEYAQGGRGGLGNIFGQHNDIGLAIPGATDGIGTGTSYWRLQSFEQTAWNPMSQEQQGGGPTVMEPVVLDQNRSWAAVSGNPLHTLHIFGKLENSNEAADMGMDIDTHISVHVVHPLNEDDNKPLSGMYSGVYVGYRNSRRNLMKQGANMTDVLGGKDLDFRAAIDPSAFHNDLPLSTWASELFGAHRNLRPSDRVACAWMVSTLMRWQICPSREHYEEIPLWLRPTPKQCWVPHSANLEYLPWPQVRDALISDKQASVEVTVNTLSVNWPFSDADILYMDQSTNHLTLAPAFKAHIASLSSWSLASSVLTNLPQLTGLAKFDDER